MELSLTKFDSILNNITCYEKVNIELLDKLITSSLLKESCNNPLMTYSNERTQLIKYKKLITDGIAVVTYKKLKIYGRSNPMYGLGLFMISKAIRHTLAMMYYIDIDIENCHPTILFQICIKYNIKCTYLKDYVINRQKYLNMVMETYNVSRDIAKNLFIRILYGGCFVNWTKDNNITYKCLPIINKFIKEFKSTANIIYKNNKTICDSIDDKSNIISSVVSYYLQEYEFRILTTIYKYCIEHNYIQNNVCVLCADGLMLETHLYKPEILNEFKTLIKNTFGFDLTFTTKKMDKNYSIDTINNNQIIVKDIDYYNYKPYTALTYDIKKNFGSSYRTTDIFTYKQFTQNKTIILQAGPGLGKTYSVMKYAKKQGMQLITISCLKSLLRQHIKTCEHKSIKLDLKYYENKFELTDDIAICINSLLKLRDLTDKQLNNTILYIDEISSFLLFTHNKNLDHIIKPIYQLLINIIKKCGKLIISDAHINDQCIDLCKLRCSGICYICNTYKSFTKIKAIKFKNKDQMITKLVDKCKKSDYFLFASDSKKIAKKIHDLCLENSNPKDKDKFILITSKSGYITKDATSEWNGKFVFYSPSIVYGIDYSVNNKQDVFMYITGKSIPPTLLFQQATRCRNIDKIYYFYDGIKNSTKKNFIFHDLQACSNHYEKCTNNNIRLHDACTYNDESDNTIITKNVFFHLFVKNEYMLTCYSSNKLYFFEKILIENEFIIENFCEDIEIINIKKTKENDNDANLFDEYINSKDKTLIKYNTFNKHIANLNLPITKLIVYKNIIVSDTKFDEYYNCIRLLRNDNYISDHLETAKENSYIIKSMFTVYNKIYLLRKLMKSFNIDYFNIKFDTLNNTAIKISKQDWYNYKTIFRISKSKPETHYELIMTIVGMIRHITSSNIIISNRIHTNINKYFVYDFNYDLIKFYLTLHAYVNPLKKDYHESIYKLFNIEPVKNNNNTYNQFII